MSSASKEDLSSLRRQLAEARENLRLIQERKAEFVLSTDMPLQLVKEERRWLDRVAELEQRLVAQSSAREDQPRADRQGRTTEAPTTTGYVFISYAREDQTYARDLAADLGNHGLGAWMDDRINFGDRWWSTIAQAVRASAAVIVVMTRAAEQSEWVEKEILLAQREGKPIFPLLLRGREFPRFITVQYVDVTSGQMPPDSFYQRLARVAPMKPKAEETLLQERLPARERQLPIEPELILIPAGEFLMGADPNKDKYAQQDQQPPQRLYLPDYSMAKTLVTNAQYAAFVKAADHARPRHWDAEKLPQGKENHPVVHVSWSDAMAYCVWLAGVTGKAYRLPSEAEWEKAARGTNGRIYPWGNESPDENRCNFAGKVRDTTPVGSYPQGASPYGLLDMAGNVWEWCNSLYRPYPYNATDGREDAQAGGKRVLRGGEFFSDARSVRCACRNGHDPAVGFDALGFRVALALGTAPS